MSIYGSDVANAANKVQTGLTSISSAIRVLADAIDKHGERNVTAAMIQANGMADAAGNTPIHRDVEGRR